MIYLKFWWHTWSPEDILQDTDLDFFGLDDNDLHISQDGINWRLPRPGTTISTIRDWMTDTNQTVTGARMLRTRKIHPPFLYIMGIGPDLSKEASDAHHHKVGTPRPQTT